jgi:hypothetical protein
LPPQTVRVYGHERRGSAIRLIGTRIAVPQGRGKAEVELSLNLNLNLLESTLHRRI